MPERSFKDLQISRFTKQTTGNYFRLFKHAKTPDSDLNQTTYMRVKAGLTCRGGS